MRTKPCRHSEPLTESTTPGGARGPAPTVDPLGSVKTGLEGNRVGKRLEGGVVEMSSL